MPLVKNVSWHVRVTSKTPDPGNGHYNDAGQWQEYYPDVKLRAQVGMAVDLWYVQNDHTDIEATLPDSDPPTGSRSLRSEKFATGIIQGVRYKPGSNGVLYPLVDVETPDGRGGARPGSGPKPKPPGQKHRKISATLPPDVAAGLADYRQAREEAEGQRPTDTEIVVEALRRLFQAGVA